MDIWLNKSIILNKELTSEEICAYIGIQMIRRRNLDVETMYISYNYICVELSGHKSYSQRFYNNIKIGIDGLNRTNIIHILDSISKTEFIIDCNDLIIDSTKDKFVIIDDSEIISIITSDTNKNKFNILRYFVVLMSCMNHKMNDKQYNGKLCGLTIKNLSELCGYVREGSISSKDGYNQFLEDLKLIYVYRTDDIIKNTDEENHDGTLRNFVNIYSRYRDKDLAIKFGKEREADLGIKANKQGMSKQIVKSKNKNRNISMNKKYQYIMSDNYNGKYTTDEITEIVEWAEKYNTKENEYKEKSKTWVRKDIDKIKSFLLTY